MFFQRWIGIETGCYIQYRPLKMIEFMMKISVLFIYQAKSSISSKSEKNALKFFYISSLIFYKDVSDLFMLSELQPYAHYTRLKFA
jgi:hypothetical protein